METAAERLIVLQDLRELREELGDAGQAAQLQALGLGLDDPSAARAEIEEAIESIRASLAPGLIRRFDTVARKYRRPLAPLRNGTCYGCFTRVPTGRFAAEQPRDGIAGCPNCGRLVYEI